MNETKQNQNQANQQQNQNQQQNAKSNPEEQTTKVKKVLNEEISQEEVQSGELDQLELYQEVYKTATVGMQSIEVLRPIVKDQALKNILFRQYNSYKALSKEVELKAAQEGYDLSPSNIMNKAMMYASVMFNTINDRSSSKLAEIMIQGINMGIISITKVTNNINPDFQVDLTLSNKLMGMLNNNLETLKVYL